MTDAAREELMRRVEALIRGLPASVPVQEVYDEQHGEWDSFARSLGLDVHSQDFKDAMLTVFAFLESITEGERQAGAQVQSTVFLLDSLLATFSIAVFLPDIMEKEVTDE